MHLRPAFLSLLVSPILLALGADAAAFGEDAAKSKPLSPAGGAVKLFNGEDLSGLYTFLRDTKYEDPRKVFTVHDGLLHISGDGWGGVITKNEYRDYHMICEFMWGERTWDTRVDRARDSGVLVHCTGPDGGYSGIWMESMEAQIIEGGVGDILVVKGSGNVPLSLTCEVTNDRDGETVWKQGGERKTFHGGRINWYGRDPDWKDVKDFRGPHDVESPHGQWTRMDVICDGGRITILVNGVKVNEGFESHPSYGKLTIQSEAAEIFVRRWELWPVGNAPAFEAAALQ